MRKVEIQSWALRVVDDVLAGRPSEDERVELKAEWLSDDYDFARRLAGHSNAARGEPILWLFGVDEKGRAVRGVESRDFASWWPTIATFFDGQCPQPLSLNIRHDDATIVALYVETDMAPYVVKNPLFGKGGTKIASEVPWRGNTSIRTAKREDLIRMLMPAIQVPEIGILKLSATAAAEGSRLKEVSVGGTIYLSHVSAQRIHLPDHLASGELTSAAGGQLAIAGANLAPKMLHDKATNNLSSANPNFVRTDCGLTALGPGRLQLSAGARGTTAVGPASAASSHDVDFSLTASITLNLRFGILGTDAAIVIKARLAPAQPTSGAVAAWVLAGTERV